MRQLPQPRKPKKSPQPELSTLQGVPA
jgi:hypothetical protein